MTDSQRSLALLLQELHAEIDKWCSGACKAKLKPTMQRLANTQHRTFDALRSRIQGLEREIESTEARMHEYRREWESATERDRTSGYLYLELQAKASSLESQIETWKETAETERRAYRDLVRWLEGDRSYPVIGHAKYDALRLTKEAR